MAEKKFLRACKNCDNCRDPKCKKGCLGRLLNEENARPYLDRLTVIQKICLALGVKPNPNIRDVQLKMPFNDLKTKKQKQAHLDKAKWATDAVLDALFGDQKQVIFEHLTTQQTADQQCKKAAVFDTMIASLKNSDRKPVARMLSVLRQFYTKDQIEQLAKVKVSSNLWCEAAVRNASYGNNFGASPGKPEHLTEQASNKVRVSTVRAWYRAAGYIVAQCQKLAHMPSIMADSIGQTFLFGGLMRPESPYMMYARYKKQCVIPEGETPLGKRLFIEVSGAYGYVA